MELARGVIAPAAELLNERGEDFVVYLSFWSLEVEVDEDNTSAIIQGIVLRDPIEYTRSGKYLVLTHFREIGVLTLEPTFPHQLGQG